MTRILAAVFAVLLPLAAGADAGTAADPFPVVLKVGEKFAICKSAQVICPPSVPICDDLAVATPDDGGADGLVWKAVGKGTTLCSVGGPGGGYGGGGARRLFRVTVK